MTKDPCWLDRRRFVAGSLASLSPIAAPGASVAFAEDSEPQVPRVSYGDVVARAEERAASAHVPRAITLAEPFTDLSYDEYRAIRMRREADPLTEEDTGFAMDLLPPGLVYRDPVTIHIVGPDGDRVVPFAATNFAFDPSQFPDLSEDAIAAAGGDLGYTGFRLRHPLNRPDVLDEFVVFQGASYFRAVARKMIYGLSARGLAIRTADPRGEEYPVFSEFWVMVPAPGARDVMIYALLESASCTGAFAFDITAGDTTVMQVRSTLFPRVELEQIGIAPLTSMYYFSPSGPPGVNDFRYRVHDSDGLQMIRGDGVRLWRPLANPRIVQTSAFVDENPQGFGLIQRPRQFVDYQDDEARYDLRPSAWVEPLGEWGEGAVMLVEIPVENEFNDNIVCFWRPAAPLGPQAGGHEFSYRLHWGAEAPDAAPLARIAATRVGRSIHAADREAVVIDFRLNGEAANDLVPDVWVSGGSVIGIALRLLPNAEFVRLSFEFAPQDNETVEMQARLFKGEARSSETWLYRWSRR